MDNQDENKRLEQEVATYLRLQQSPIYFIELVWGLRPQPIKNEYIGFISEILSLSLFDYKERVKEITVDMFGEFEKGKHITWQQRLILISIEKGANRITVASGHGIGKSTCMSWILLWFLFTHKKCRIGCTAPTKEQMEDVLWTEIAVWLDKMPESIKDQYERSSDYIRMKDSPDYWWARAKTAKKDNPEALAGLHADDVCILVDEASGVDDIIYTKAEGAMTSGSTLMVMISNPTRLIGYFYDSHHSDRKNWLCLQFNGLDSPVVKDLAERAKEKYGEDSDEFRYMVLGEFPKSDGVDDKGYVPLLLEQDLHYRAMEPDPKQMFIGFKKLGVDPAGEGSDETKGVLRDNFCAMQVFSEKVSTELSIAEKTGTAIVHYNIPHNNVYVDNFGVGANVAVKLAQARINVNGVNWGDKAWDEERFLNRRAECFWRLAEWLRKGGQLVGDAKLWREDLTMIRYKRTLAGKIQIMSKEDMKKMFGKSPDIADALAYTFWDKDRDQSDSAQAPQMDFSHLL